MSEFPIWSLGEQDTVTAALSRAATLYTDRIFLDFTGDTYTYGQVNEAADRLARGLVALGVRKGDRVASILDNNFNAVIAWFAINKAGAISVPVNTAYKGEFLRHQINDCGAQIVLAETDYGQRIVDIEADLEHVTTLVLQSIGNVRTRRLRALTIAETFASPGTQLPDPNVPSDLSMLIYTAGTTGPSKGCMISHNYVCNIARQVVYNDNRTCDDINWTALPFFHMNATGGSLLSSIMVGARVAIFPRFSVSRFWPDIRRSRANVASLLGSMIHFLAEADDTPDSKACFGQLKMVRGSPFPAALQQKWRDRFGVTRAGSNAYGLTEAARVTTLRHDQSAPPGSSGRANSDFDVRIVDDQDNELPNGQAGEIVIRPRRPHVMFEGYWNRPKETLAVMGNLWLHTGDIGRFDEEGFFYFVDRKKDYLRRRGENISTHEVENSLRAHPAIADVAVHAVLAESGEDDVKATIVRKNDAKANEEEICRWAIERLPYFAVPRYFEFRDDLPRNPVGRVQKYKLREEGCTPLTWDREHAGVEVPRR